MLFPSLAVFITFAVAVGAFQRRQNDPLGVTPIQSAAAALNIALAYTICQIANQALFAASAIKGTPTPSYFDQCKQIAVTYPGFHGPKSRVVVILSMPTDTAA